MIKKIVIASDHGGYELKENLKKFLMDIGYEVIDLGANSEKSVNYPTFAHKIAKKISLKEFEKGILLCGSGIGVSITANRHKGVRAALVNEPVSARLSREHNDANLLCMGGRFVTPTMAEEIVKIFLETNFEGGRHSERVKMIEDLTI